MRTNELSEDAKKLSVLANENLSLLSGKCQEEFEMQDYYLGILRRHAILLTDLSLILKDRNSECISTPFILLRCLLDDFLHLLYLELRDDKANEITKINADVYKHSFNALIDLTNSNYENFNGKYQFYLTYEQLKEVQDKFISKEKNKKYFKNQCGFKFKGFKRINDMVNTTSYSRNVNIFRDRAYYLWKEFSSFVHYSNYSFKYELRGADENLNMIDESFQYCYNSIYLAFKYFERNLNIEFKNETELLKKYGIVHDC
jgi:hypothetical protein